MPRTARDDDSDVDMADMLTDSEEEDGTTSSDDSDNEEEQGAIAGTVRRGRPPSRVYDDPPNMNWHAQGLAARAGRDAASIGVAFGQAAAVEAGASGPRRGARQRNQPQQFEAGAASCFTRTSRAPPSEGEAPQQQAAAPPKRARSDEGRCRHPGSKAAKAKHKATRARSAVRAAAREKVLAAQDDNAMELFLEFSWRQRKSIAISTFASSRNAGHSKTDAYVHAALAARVGWRTAHDWVHRWRRDEGALFESSWGKNKKVPHYFQDEEVILKSTKWWQSHRPRKGASPSLSGVSVTVSVTVSVRVLEPSALPHDACLLTMFACRRQSTSYR